MILQRPPTFSSTAVAYPKGTRAVCVPDANVRSVTTSEYVERVAYMRAAMQLAADAESDGDVPIGAVLVVDGRTFYARNEKERRPDPTAHAELLAIRSAAATLGTWRLSDATLYVTKEPCIMCAGAIVAARVAHVVFGCRDPKGGAAGSVIDVFASEATNHAVQVTGGVLAAETASQLTAFFARKRARKRS